MEYKNRELYIAAHSIAEFYFRNDAEKQTGLEIDILRYLEKHLEKWEKGIAEKLEQYDGDWNPEDVAKFLSLNVRVQ